MRLKTTLPLSAALLAMALAVPVAAMAKDRDHGQKRGGGRSYAAERSHSGKRESAQRGDRRSSRRIELDAWRGMRGQTRGDFRDRSYARADRGSRGPGARDTYRGDVRYRAPRSDYRAPRSDYRANVRWRGDVRRDSRVQRSGRYYGDDYRPRVTSRVRYRDGGPNYAYYRPRHYYSGHFHRPRFVYRSGFSLGFVIGLTPSYGYRYYDPFCDLSFSHLGAYYDHCYGHSHAEVILLVDVNGGYPIATCAYQDGDWVVDDCYDDRYDDGY
jgi:hypothetical protein